MIFGAGYAVLVGLLVVANHPLPVDAAGTATCGALGIGLTATAAVAMSAYRRGTRIPLGLLAAATALATGGEVLAPSDEVVIEGIRLSTGPQWLPALAESWPRLLLCAAAFLAATTWGRTWGVAARSPQAPPPACSTARQCRAGYSRGAWSARRAPSRWRRSCWPDGVWCSR
ncbi:hypothetical protein ACFQ0O_04140 [Saccharopolyspora spinosporotrichia]